MKIATVTPAGLPAVFEPQATRTNVAKADALIEYAKTVRDWPTLELAVDEKVEQQQEFVRWWRENVRRKGEKRNNADRGYFVTDAEEQTGITQQQVSKWGKRLQDLAKYRELLFGVAYRKAMGDVDNHRAMGTGENEWYTPSQYVEAARSFMGGIDLDPASSAIAQERIQATRYFTPADDGLKQKWGGRVWLNPPYSQPLIQQFCEKMVEEVRSTRVSQAVMLTHNYTDTAWFHLAEAKCAAICFTRGRIKFICDDGEIAAPTQGQAFFYYGSKREKFVEAFTQFGFIR